eukprot:3677811-Rhodomonas_salina.3
MSGTDILHSPYARTAVLTERIVLRACHAMSSTLLLPLHGPVLAVSTVLRACYADSGTNLAYAATRT